MVAIFVQVDCVFFTKRAGTKRAIRRRFGHFRIGSKKKHDTEDYRERFLNDFELFTASVEGLRTHYLQYFVDVGPGEIRWNSGHHSERC